MRCPDCGSRRVTVEPGPDVSPSSTVTRAVLQADEEETIEVSRVCWKCGWEEIRHVTLTAIRIENGDESVIRRKRLIDELYAELEELPGEKALREARSAVTDIRRSSTGATERDGPEPGERWSHGGRTCPTCDGPLQSRPTGESGDTPAEGRGGVRVSTVECADCARLFRVVLVLGGMSHLQVCPVCDEGLVMGSASTLRCESCGREFKIREETWLEPVSE